MFGGQAADVVVVYAIADRLGKFVYEVLAMPVAELNGWVAFIEYQNKLRK